MLIKATLIHENGHVFGVKSVPENCLAVKWGGSVFVLIAHNKRLRVATYQRTDTFHFNELDEKR